jgi:hypothetical protein
VFDGDPTGGDCCPCAGHPTPELAAIGDLPLAFVKVIRVCRADDGRQAVVMIQTNEFPLAWEAVEVVLHGEAWHAIRGVGSLGMPELPQALSVPLDYT